MKKTGFYILILFAIALFANSCCPDKKYYTIKDKDKLSFNKGDRFIYKSNLGNYDTLVVEQIKDTTEYYTDTEGLCVTQLYEEHIYYFLNTPGKRYQPNNRPYFSLKYNSDESKIDFFGYFYILPGKYWKNIDIGTYFLNNNTYENTQYYVCYSCQNDSAVKRFYVNKKNGIILYQYVNGESYVIFNYIYTN